MRSLRCTQADQQSGAVALVAASCFDNGRLCDGRADRGGFNNAVFCYSCLRDDAPRRRVPRSSHIFRLKPEASLPSNSNEHLPRHAAVRLQLPTRMDLSAKLSWRCCQACRGCLLQASINPPRVPPCRWPAFIFAQDESGTSAVWCLRGDHCSGCCFCCVFSFNW